MRPWLTLLPWFVSCLEKLGILARALKAGNANRIIAFNPGVQDRVRPHSRHEDYTCGEQNRFLDQPVSRWTGGEPYACELAKPVQAQFVRVSAVKPDGPDQKGAQMAVAELEAYE